LEKQLRLGTAQPEYLPGLEYFWKLAQCDSVIFTDHFQFTKRSPITASPPLSGFGSSMRIPVKHTEAALTISEKKIDMGQSWSEKHLKSLHHQFHLTPFGYYYLPKIEEIYREKIDSLSDFLILLIENFITFFHLPITVKRASNLSYTSDNTKTIIDWSHNLNAAEYITSDEVISKGWIEKNRIINSGITLNTFASLPEYHILQSYNDFSAIGFLMQYGPEAGYILKQYLPPK
jgi:hypothetical protein